MKEQAKNPRIIIDASYIRSMGKDEARSCFEAMRTQGGRIVIIDTLSYELFCASARKQQRTSEFDIEQWRIAKDKLKAYSDAIEVWKHVPLMWCCEIKQKCRYGGPLLPDKTEQMQKMLATNTQWEPLNPKDICDAAKQNREYDSIIKIFRNVADLQLFTEKEKSEIQNKLIDSDKVIRSFYDLVNNPVHIRDIIRIILQESNIGVSLDINTIDDNWVIWHFAKSFLVMYCYNQYQGNNIYEVREEILMNTKHDLDYLISLAFADAIASKDKKEMSRFRQWMFGDKKPLIDSHQPEDITRILDNVKTGL